MIHVPFPCTVERQPLDARFRFPHNVVCASRDDLHAGDVVVAVCSLPLVRPFCVDEMVDREVDRIETPTMLVELGERVVDAIHADTTADPRLRDIEVEARAFEAQGIAYERTLHHQRRLVAA